MRHRGLRQIDPSRFGDLELVIADPLPFFTIPVLTFLRPKVKKLDDFIVMVRLTPKAVREIGRRYQDSGLEQALYEKQRPGAAKVLEDSQRQRIIAMVCSDPPEGRARWTVRLVVEEAIKRRLVPRVGRETIRILLLHHDFKPWREKNVVRSRTQ